MKVIVYEPKKKPYVKEMGTSFINFRKDVIDIVGEDLDFRLIQHDDGTLFQLITNDLSMINKLPRNRRIYRGDTDYDVIRGSFVVTQVKIDEKVSMEDNY